MPDLNERMRGVDHVPFREDWDAVERRGPATEPMHDRTGSHAAKAIALLAATLLVLGVALYSLSGLGSSTDGAGTGPTPGNSSTATYIDPAGIPITVDYPPNWFARSFSTSADDGIAISNVESVVPPKDLAGQDLPLNYVTVTISASRQQVAPVVQDSPLPLSMDDASVTLGDGNTRQLMARVSGVPFVIQVSAGPNASEADLATADAIVASIRPNVTSPSASEVSPSPAGLDRAAVYDALIRYLVASPSTEGDFSNTIRVSTNLCSMGKSNCGDRLTQEDQTNPPLPAAGSWGHPVR